MRNVKSQILIVKHIVGDFVHNDVYNEKIKSSDTFTEVWTYSEPIAYGWKEKIEIIQGNVVLLMN